MSKWSKSGCFDKAIAAAIAKQMKNYYWCVRGVPADPTVPEERTWTFEQWKFIIGFIGAAFEDYAEMDDPVTAEEYAEYEKMRHNLNIAFDLLKHEFGALWN